MKCRYEFLPDKENPESVRILECVSLDTMAVIPEMIASYPVTELAPYAFSDRGSRMTDLRKSEETFIWSDDDTDDEDSDAGNSEGEEFEDLPAITGDRLEKICLPSSLKKVGAYAFYNCANLKEIEFYSTTLDWGAGVFAGCYAVDTLSVYVDESRRSCLKDVLSQLHQSLNVEYHGEGEARLIFSDFYEEAVENTPARILVTNTHGCGKQYRNAFVNTQFQFQEYDSLFPYVKVQEEEEFVARLALSRVRFPYKLSDKYRNDYLDYLKIHSTAAACQAVKRHDPEELTWVMDNLTFDGEQMETIISQAGKADDQSAVSYLMEENRRQGNMKRRHFSL